jgi:hypothetical protein
MSHVMRHGRRIETVSLDAPAVQSARRAVHREHQFIKVPVDWADKLGAAKNAATAKVALRILRLHFFSRGRPVELGNQALQKTGVSRMQKHRALAELEHLGLVRVRRRPLKSPIVTAILKQK